MNERKILYKEFVNSRSDIPLFQQSYWLDAVCGEDNWFVILHNNSDGAIDGFMTYYMEKIKGQKIIKLPPLTPYMGIWLDSEVYDIKKRSTYNKISASLIGQLPKTTWINQAQSPAYNNWLPFYWDNYNSSVMYTYIIPKDKQLEVISRDLKSSLKKIIKRSESRLDFVESEDIDLYYSLLEKSFSKNKAAMPYSKQFLDNLYKKLKEEKVGQLYLAIGKDKSVNGGILLGMDKQQIHVLGFGKNYNIAISETSEFMQWKSIEIALGNNKGFNFNGSMVKGINKMITAFPSEQQIYYRMYKGKNKLIDALHSLK
jgi:hypothetical protein